MSETVMIILACAAATYLTRIGGHLVLSRFERINYRIEAALDAVPVAVLSALVAPSFIKGSWVEALAIGIAGLLAMRFSLIISVGGGLLALVILRGVLS